jgi:site-specific recombinase XerD
MEAYLYQLSRFFKDLEIPPPTYLKYSKQKMKKILLDYIHNLANQGSKSYARHLMYAVLQLCKVNNKEIKIDRDEKTSYSRQKYKIEYIPDRDTVYQMADECTGLTSLRDRAIILCLFQSGVRATCLCNWTYNLVKEQIEVKKIDLPIKLMITDEMDRKLRFNELLEYYYTFLHEYAVLALNDYIESRKVELGWEPKDSDIIFISEGWRRRYNKRGKRTNNPLTRRDLLDIIKKAAANIGIDPSKIWTHCLRKSFENHCRFSGGLDHKNVEIMMGHNIGIALHYIDLELLKKEYMKVPWMRGGSSRVDKLEKIIKELDNKVNEFEEKINCYEAKLLFYEKLKTKFNSMAEDIIALKKAIKKK